MKDDLDEKELEELEERLEHVEFNNEEEDSKMMKEKRIHPEDKNRIILMVSILLIVLVSLGAGYLLRGLFDHKEKQEENKNPSEEKVDFDDTSKLVNLELNNASFFFDTYLYNDNTKSILGLDGKEILSLDKGYEIRKGIDSLYEYSLDDAKKVVVKKLVNKKWKKVLEIQYESIEETAYIRGIINTNHQFIGVYDNRKTTNRLYLLEKDSYQEEILDNLRVYLTSSIEDKVVYDNEYITTYSKDSTLSSPKMGLYHLKTNKEVLKPIYSELDFISTKEIIAKKDNKAGIIDSTGKVLLDFKYDTIKKVGKYFVAEVNHKLLLLDSNYKKVDNISLEIPIYSTFEGISFFDNVLIGVKDNNDITYYYLDNNQFIKLVTGTIKIVDTYCIVQENNSTTMSIYDKNLDKVTEIDFQESIKDYTMYLFLNNYLSCVKGEGENITKKFFNIEQSAKTEIRTFMRDHGDYRVSFTFTTKEKGILLIKKGEEEIGKLENASFLNYISSPNNGITLKNKRILYYAERPNSFGDILLIQEKES